MHPLPLSLFPPVSWFVSGIEQNSFLVNTSSVYVKQSHFNRYTIGGPNDYQNLIIPIVHTGMKKMINEARISEHSKWVREHIHAMNCAYNKAPFYEFYDYKVHEILTKHSDSLLDLIIASIELLHNQLRIDIPLQFIESKESDFAMKNTIPYPQVFEEKFGFRPGLSALDLLFNLGPETESHLKAI